MANKPTGVSLLKQKEIAVRKKDTWDTLWQVCLDYADPAHDGITSFRTKGENVSDVRLIDICMRANLTYSSGLYSFLCNGDWLRFSSGNLEDKKDHTLAKWWNDASILILNSIESSNFKDEIVQFFKSLGSIGTSCMLTEYIDGKLMYRFFDITEYSILEDNYRKVDSVFRTLKFSSKQAIQEFGYDKVSEKVKKDFDRNGECIFEYTHIVQPRINRKKSEANKDMPFASYYVEDESKKIIKEGGFESFPYSVCRVDKSRKEIFGRSSMSYAIASANILQYYEQTFLAISDRKSHPNWLVDRHSHVEGLTNAKDGITYYDSRRGGSPPQRLVEDIDTNFTRDDRLDKEQAVEEAFHVPLFDALKDYRNMTATEAQERVSSSISRIAPVVSRIINEGLRPICERTFMAMLKNGDLPQIPKGYEDKFTNVKASFFGRLSQLTEELELNNIQRGVDAVFAYAEFKPEMLDYVDGDELAQALLINSNTPSKIIPSKETVEKLRDSRAQQLKQEQAVATMSATADAVSKTSATPQSGSPAEQIMGEMP